MLPKNGIARANTRLTNTYTRRLKQVTMLKQVVDRTHRSFANNLWFKEKETCQSPPCRSPPVEMDFNIQPPHMERRRNPDNTHQKQLEVSLSSSTYVKVQVMVAQ